MIYKKNTTSLLKICLFFPVNFRFFEKSFHIGIPFFLKRFIHGECPHGNSGDTLQDGAVVMEIQVQPRDVFRGKCTYLMSVQKIPEVFRRKGEDNLKMKRRPFSFDEAETEVPDFSPVGIIPRRLFIEKVFVQEPVQSKFVEGSDFPFDERKFIEGVPK